MKKGFAAGFEKTAIVGQIAKKLLTFGNIANVAGAAIDAKGFNQKFKNQYQNLGQ